MITLKFAKIIDEIVFFYDFIGIRRNLSPLAGDDNSLIYRIAPVRPETFINGFIIIHRYNNMPISSPCEKDEEGRVKFFLYNLFILFIFLFFHF